MSSRRLAKLGGGVLFGYHRLALRWHAARERRGPPIKVRRDGDLIRIEDGTREIRVPEIRAAVRFRDGIGAILDRAAAKYLGETGYTPRVGDVVVDIGAGIGEFTLWCAQAGADVLAFEPDPLAFACLERNTASLPGISLLPYALWKERANLRLHGSLDTAESSLIEDGTYRRLADVPAWPLDAVPAVVALPVIDFLKLDAEGVEPEIIAGATRTLRRTRVISVDVGAIAKRPNLPAKVESALEALNFRPVPHERTDTILSVNTAMVGPFSIRGGGRPGS